MKKIEFIRINEDSVYDAFLRCKLLKGYNVLIVANGNRSAQIIIKYILRQAYFKTLYTALKKNKIVFQKSQSTITVVSDVLEVPKLMYNHILYSKDFGSNMEIKAYLRQHLTNYWE